MTDTISTQMAAAHDAKGPVLTPEMLQAQRVLATASTTGTPTPEEFIKLVKEHKGEFVQTEADVGGNPL